MKKNVYRILTHLPIIGVPLKALTIPRGLYGSNEIASGYTAYVISLYEQYSKTHPGEQLTKQLVEKLILQDRHK